MSKQIRYAITYVSLLPIITGFVVTWVYPDNMYVRGWSYIAFNASSLLFLLFLALIHPSESEKKIYSLKIESIIRFSLLVLILLNVSNFFLFGRDVYNAVAKPSNYKVYSGHVDSIGTTGLSSLWSRMLQVTLDDGTKKSFQYPFPYTRSLANKRWEFIVTPSSEILLEMREVTL